MARRACRTDNNHAAIAQAFRQLGMSVQDLSAVGKGCPDLAVGYRGVTCLVEIKDGAKTEGNRPLTQAQKDWHAAWGGHVVVALSPQDAIEKVIAHAKETGRV